MSFRKLPSFFFSSFIKKTPPRLQFFDIAANLADKTFSGYYYSKQCHDSDIDAIIERAQNEGCDRLLIVGTSTNLLSKQTS